MIDAYTASLVASQHKQLLETIAKMDDETRTHLEAMEARLMGRITGLQEQMLDRFQAVDQQFTSAGATLKSMNTTLELMTSLLSDFARRITDLEKS